MIRTVIAISTLMGLGALPASAQSKGDFTLGIGLGYVVPDESDSNTTVGPIDVQGSLRPTFTAEYFILDNIGIELLASLPFEHDVSLAGAGQVADAKQLPPTLSLQYHFTNKSKVTPFVGAGINYTHFFDASGTGALNGSSVSLDDSWGIAFHAGLDYEIGAHGSFRVDVRWVDIDTDVEVNGVSIGSANVDPWVFNVAYVYGF